MLYQNLCETCGAILEKVSETHYECKSCGNIYSTEKVENYTKKLKEILDEAKFELVSEAKKNLYKAITDSPINASEIIKWCFEIKKYLHNDFQANFYETFINKPKQETAKMIRKININEDFECLEALVIFLIKSLEPEIINDTMFLIERLYKINSNNLEKFNKYATMLSIEVEKLNNCIYETNYPRDVFVAYSSKDTEKAFELVELLEEQGLSCFISIRNLRHGSGAKENYIAALKEAIDNCTSFVFISSKNSRNSHCDAIRIEMNYVKSRDKQIGENNGYINYSDIPATLKKKRVEYRIDESKGFVAADKLVDEFFDGYQQVYTPEAVAERIAEQLCETVKNVETVDTVEENTFKYCAACACECSNNAWQCPECGNYTFADTQKKALLIKSLTSAEKTLEEIKNFQKLLQDAINSSEESEDEYEYDVSETQIDNIRESSKGLEFELNEDGKSYALIKVGSCKEKNIVIDMHKGLSVTSIGNYAFSWCDNLTSITIPNSITSIGEKAFLECKNLTSITIPNSVTSIGYRAFANCSKLTTIAIPNSVREIGVEAFEYCPIKKAILPAFALKSIQKYHLKEVVLTSGNLDTDFLQKSSITSITITDNVTSIGYRAFAICSSLTNITIENSVTSIGDWAFTGCSSLTSITIPNSVTSIGKSAFFACSKLTSITIPNSVTSIGEDAFSWCSKLTNISVDVNNAKYKSIDGNIYTKDEKTLMCYAAGKTDKSFTIPNSVMSIGNNAFYRCENLTSITIPDSVTSIGNGAFHSCSNLTSIYCFDNWDNIVGIEYACIPKETKIFYYSEKKPRLRLFKRYWHYVDGVPTEW